MRPENAALYAAIGEGEEVFTAALEQQVAPLQSVTDEQIVEALGGTLAPADNTALTGKLADYMAACMRPSMN